MKSSLATVLFFLAVFISGAQQPVVHKHTHSWAGGVCCATGTDYTWTIKIPKGEWQRFDSLKVCTGSEQLSFGFKQLTKTEKGDTLVIIVSKSYSYNRYNKGIDIDIKEKPDPVIPCTCAVICLVKEYTRKELTVTSESQSMTAYP
ncbi:MAG: hypothetical protein ACHQF2_00580 [Flavobacteriales bacterium]